ncbi:hypothetical protein POM88_047517 [Heracleum sosnowskyi]|uniref:Transmembrane protein n=1 Tax=Heracleum sosnowskyi TaxID=360622 RepID=A0AAD8GTE2_9APIA|nr:hypothetical protein POM88_047517 [Heracleum sosnowskyi]
MEKNQESMKKKSMSIKIVSSGSGGLAGIILLGGALATAALVSTFAFKRKQKFKKSSKVVKEDAEGLSFIVSDSLSPRLDHRSSSDQNELVSMETMILDGTRQVNGEKDEEFDILKKAREGLSCDESVTGMEEITVPVADGSLLLKPDEMKNNDLLEENAVLRVNEKILMADSYEVGVADVDQHIPLEEDEVCDGIGKNIYGNNKQQADQVDGKKRVPAEECNEIREVIIESEEVLIEVPQSEQLGIDCDYHKIGDECDANGQILVEKRGGLVEVAVVDKIRADGNRYKGGEESDDDLGVTIEKSEVLVGDVAANGIQLSEKLESTTMYGDHDILCSNEIHRYENGICDVKKTDLLLPIDSSSLLKPADHGHVENLLVIEDTKILEVEEANRSSSGTDQNEFVSGETAILDETRQVNGEKDDEFDILKKAREGLLCDEYVAGMEDIPVLVADGSLLLKPDEMKNNDLLEENAVLKVNEKIMMADSDEVGLDDDQHILVEEDDVCDETGNNIYGNNKQLADQAFGKERVPAEKCNGTTEVIIEREEVLVEVPQSEQLGIDYDYHKLGDGCDGNGQILVEKREGLVRVAVVDKIRADDNPYRGGEESNDVGVTIEKGEVLVGDVAANGIQLSEKLESTGMKMGYNQDILCSNDAIINRYETGICDVKKTDLLLPIDSSSSLLKPADHGHVESLLVTEDTKILEVEEANATEDSIKVEEERGQTHLLKANDDNKIYKEITIDKSMGTDENGVEYDQQMQPSEEYQKNHINEDQKYSSHESSPETNSFQCNGCEEQEFSFPLLDSLPYFNFGNLIKNDSSETAQHVEKVNQVEKVNPMEKDDRPADEVFAYQIILENKPLVQSEKNDEMKSFDDGSENDVVEGEETLETGHVDIDQKTELSEQYKFSNGSKNDEEALQLILTENFELENNQESPLKEDSYYGDNVNREEDSNGDFADEDAEKNSDSDEEDSVDGSSETTGDSSLDSNAEATWPVESVQEFSEKVKDRIHSNNRNYMETERGDSNVNFNTCKLEEEERNIFDMDFRNKLTAEITTLRQPANLFSMKFWFLSLLVPFLLVLWLLSSQISFPGASHPHLQ